MTIKRSNAKFVARVTIIHVITYILCGMVFSMLFDYERLFALGNTAYFMRPVDSASSLLGPLMQVVRGVLFGLVLLLFRNSYEGKKYGWLKLWAIIVVIGIINTPGPAPFSIEGLIYTQLPLEVHLKGAPEILVQTLLFSWFVAGNGKRSKRNLSPVMKTAVVTAIISAVGFSVSGILLALVLGIDPAAGIRDGWAFAVMFASVAIVFFTTLWYVSRRRGVWGAILYYTVCYLSLAALPTVYNFLSGSPFSSSWSFLLSALPLAAIIPYVENRRNRIECKALPY